MENSLQGGLALQYETRPDAQRRNKSSKKRSLRRSSSKDNKMSIGKTALRKEELGRAAANVQEEMRPGRNQKSTEYLG